MPLSLTSSGFESGAEIPERYTCDGSNISPALSWSGIPGTAQSLLLIIDDPDAPDPEAPQRIWTHWTLYNIPPGMTGLPEGMRSRDLPAGIGEGLNDWGNSGYGGPCPHIGRHRYFHRLYALDTTFEDLGHPTRSQLEKMMQGHVIEEAELIGTYQRKTDK